VLSAWRRRGDVLEVSVDVPPGTRAEVRLPDGQRAAAGPGSHAFACGYAPTML
jgi:alpha-L-rhamnosidase